MLGKRNVNQHISENKIFMCAVEKSTNFTEAHVASVGSTEEVLTYVNIIFWKTKVGELLQPESGLKNSLRKEMVKSFPPVFTLPPSRINRR